VFLKKTQQTTQVAVDDDEKVLHDYMSSKPPTTNVKVPQKQAPIVVNNTNTGIRSKIDKELADLELAMGMA